MPPGSGHYVSESALDLVRPKNLDEASREVAGSAWLRRLRNLTPYHIL